MVVAMVAMRMMEASIHQVVHMAAMRDGGVAAIGAMNMLRCAFGGGKAGSALVRIGGTDGNRVFIHMVPVRMMQMAVMKIIHMPFVLDGGVSASRAVHVRMIGVSGTRFFAHNFLNFWCYVMSALSNHSQPLLLRMWQQMFLQVTCI